MAGTVGGDREDHATSNHGVRRRTHNVSDVGMMCWGCHVMRHTTVLSHGGTLLCCLSSNIYVHACHLLAMQKPCSKGLEPVSVAEKRYYIKLLLGAQDVDAQSLVGKCTGWSITGLINRLEGNECVCATALNAPVFVTLAERPIPLCPAVSRSRTKRIRTCKSRRFDC